MAKKVDIIDVMLAVNNGELKVAVHNGFFTLEHTKSGERVRLNESDVEQVVRCKNCKSAYINSFSAASGVAVCKKWSNEAETVIVQHDDFCSYGERREGE